MPSTTVRSCQVLTPAPRQFRFRVEFGTFPNWNGDVQKRTFTLSGDELSYVNPTSTVAATKVLAVWKRAK